MFPMQPEKRRKQKQKKLEDNIFADGVGQGQKKSWHPYFKNVILFNLQKMLRKKNC